MPFGSTFANDLLLLVFNATAIATIADNAASGALTNLYVTAHTADPTASGTQTSSEADYTNYDRVAVARSGSGWTVTTTSVSPAAEIEFPAAGSGTPDTLTHFMVGTAASSTGKQLFSGTITPNITASEGVTPILTTATTITLT